MLNALMPATFKDVAKTNQVGLDVGGRILNRVPHPSLGRQMDHRGGLVLRESRFHRRPILQIGFDQRPGGICTSRRGLELGNPGPFQGGVVIGIEVVEPHHPLAASQQALAHGCTDEACSAAHEHGHGWVAAPAGGTACKLHDILCRILYSLYGIRESSLRNEAMDIQPIASRK